MKLINRLDPDKVTQVFYQYLETTFKAHCYALSRVPHPSLKLLVDDHKVIAFDTHDQPSGIGNWKGHVILGIPKLDPENTATSFDRCNFEVVLRFAQDQFWDCLIGGYPETLYAPYQEHRTLLSHFGKFQKSNFRDLEEWIRLQCAYRLRSGKCGLDFEMLKFVRNELGHWSQVANRGVLSRTQVFAALVKANSVSVLPVSLYESSNYSPDGILVPIPYGSEGSFDKLALTFIKSYLKACVIPPAYQD